MAKLLGIEGIGEAYAAKLEEIGLKTQKQFLEQGASVKGREALAAKTGIGSALILKWVNHCDLIRVKGVGGQYSELLEAAGVDTVPELAQRKPENLVEALRVVNADKRLCRRPPVLKQVQGWVEQAKALPRIVNY